MTDDIDWRERALRAEADLAEAKRDLDKTTRDLCRWRAAIQKMTPGGSEFMDPQAVADWAEMQRRDCAEAKAKAAWARKDLATITAQRDAAVEALRPFADLAAHYDRPYGNRPNKSEHGIYSIVTHGIGENELRVGHLRKARDAFSTSAALLQHREREKAVIEAARAYLAWQWQGIYPREDCPYDRSLADALASLDTEGASNAG